MTRFDKLLARYNDKKNGSINADLMVAVHESLRVESIRMQLRFAEMELQHAIRGLEHKDYDSVFEGWERAE